MNAPTFSMAAACMDSFISGLLVCLSIYMYPQGTYWWIAFALLALFFVYRVIITLLKHSDFISVTGEMIDAFALYIFDGNEASVDKVLNLLISSKAGESKTIKDIIFKSINSAKEDNSKEII